MAPGNSCRPSPCKMRKSTRCCGAVAPRAVAVPIARWRGRLRTQLRGGVTRWRSTKRGSGPEPGDRRHGSALTASLVVIGDKLGLYGPWPGGALPEAAARCRTSTLRARVALGAGRGRLRDLRRATQTTRCPASVPAGREDSPPACSAASGHDGGVRGASGEGGISHRQGCWHERPRPASAPSASSARLQREPGRLVDPALDGVGTARSQCERGRHRLRHRLFDLYHGQGLPAFQVRRLRLPPALDRERARARGARRRRRSGALRGGVGEGLSRQIRSGHVLRLPARHGRSGRRGAPRALDAVRQRHLDAGRAVRARPHRGQPEPPRPRVLLGVDAGLPQASLAQEVGLALGAQAGESACATCSRGRLLAHPARATGRRSTSSSRFAPEASTSTWAPRASSRRACGAHTSKGEALVPGGFRSGPLLR